MTKSRRDGHYNMSVSGVSQSSETPRVTVDDAQPLHTYPRAVQEQICEPRSFTICMLLSVSMCLSQALLSRALRTLSALVTGLVLALATKLSSAEPFLTLTGITAFQQ
jgi:hypothetical protein